MTIHLIKLCVGADRIDDLKSWQHTLLQRNKGTRLQGLVHHTTRMFPKRAEELKDGGSIYWVIAGQIQVRQPIVDLQEVTTNEGRKCRIVLEPGLILVNPTVKGPFQGWRYLKPEDAPGDLGSSAEGDDLPIRAELAELGLL
ncbi:DUF1489 family protein [Parvularcula lutaonensis]|uniref:DUF1489 family protein n=1 Tax=Parvularcula lutaonensis TaxID=491923 RepID=A0ABV7MD50_9PROT|nr:DUF1489 domain-containing protein [Parvularcula lutaonensis]GGY52434.1 hypothetical protein GCM10007148_21920 [Parvularcula lutaonensis]